MAYIDVVTGFFEGGKTSFTKKLIKKEAFKYFDKILVVNYELGFEKYDEFFKRSIKDESHRKYNHGLADEEINMNEKYREDCSIVVEDMDVELGFDIDRLNNLLRMHNPDYVIIEYNGIWDISKLVESKFEKGFHLRRIINIIDYNSFEILIKNMEKIMVDKIINCDTVVVTKYKEGDSLDNSLIEAIRSINKVCDIYFDIDLFLNEEIDSDEFINKKITTSEREVLIFGFLFFLINASIIGGKFLYPDFFGEGFQRFIGVFISMLVQILPFLVMGSVISGLVQVFSSGNKILALFQKTSLKNIIVSLFIGIIFPVCDCGIVTLAKTIIKKDSSIPVVITFLLASSSVNPVVIISTYYAFSGNIKIVFYKTFLGIFISFLVGIILWFLGFDKKTTTLKSPKIDIKNRYMDNFFSEGKGRIFEALVIHLKNEFFTTGRYVILGSIVSAFIQVFISKEVFLGLGAINFISVATMIIASFFISVCSTSNPFIARSFLGLMPQNSVLAFMVMGPMLDITNISVLSMSFKKRFLLFLVAVLIYLGIIVFSLMGGIKLA